MYGKDEKEALSKLAELKAKYQAGLYDFNCNTPFRKWAQDYMDLYYKGTVTEATYRNAKSILEKYIIPNLGAMPLGHIKPAHINACIATMNGKSKSYTQKAKQLLQRIFEKAVVNEMIRSTPVIGITMPLAAEYKPRRALTPEEQAILRATILKHEKGILFGCLLACGLRPQEARGLRWTDIDFDKQTLTISRAVASYTNKIKAPKSRSGYRTIPIPNWYCELLKDYPRDPKSPYVFFGTGDKPMTDRRFVRAWRSFSREMDIAAGATVYRNQVVEHALDQEITPYYLRHTFATNLVEKGLDIKSVQYFMGHSGVRITVDTYTHFTQKMFDIAKEKMNA